MKVSGVISSKKDFYTWFTNDGEAGVHIWFKRLVLEYVMLYWTTTHLIYTQFLGLLFLAIWQLILRIFIWPLNDFKVGLGWTSCVKCSEEK
jgi:hypothetical protein